MKNYRYPLKRPAYLRGWLIQNYFPSCEDNLVWHFKSVLPGHQIAPCRANKCPGRTLAGKISFQFFSPRLTSKIKFNKYIIPTVQQNPTWGVLRLRHQLPKGAVMPITCLSLSLCRGHPTFTVRRIGCTAVAGWCIGEIVCHLCWGTASCPAKK